MIEFASKRPKSTVLPHLFLFSILAVTFTFGGIKLEFASSLAYIIVFFILSWRRPDLALALIFALAPFQQDLFGGAIKLSLAESSLLLALPALFYKNFRRGSLISLGPITIPVILYFAVCLYSSWSSWRPQSALISLLQMFLYMFCAVTVFASLVERQGELNRALNWFVFVGCLLAIMVFFSGNYALGLNKNGIGGSLSVAIVVGAELWENAQGKKRLLLFLANIIIAVGLVFSLSRGAWIGAFLGLFSIFILRRKFKLLRRAIIFFIPLIAILWQILPYESRYYALDLNLGTYNIVRRLDSVELAKTYFEKNTLFGSGVGLRKEYDATNLIWLVLAETGILGLISFLLIFYVFFRMAWKTQKYFERKDPIFSILVIGSALTLNKLAHGMVDHYWSRGQSLLAWAGTGMAIGVYLSLRRRRKEKRSGV